MPIRISLAEAISILSLSATAALKNDVTPILRFASVTFDGDRFVAASTDRYMVGRISSSHPARVVADETTLLLDLTALKPFVAAAKAATPRNLAHELTITVEPLENGDVTLTSAHGPATRSVADGRNYPPVGRLMPEERAVAVPELAYLRVDANLIARAAKLLHPAEAVGPKPVAVFDWHLSPFGELGKPSPVLLTRRPIGDLADSPNLIEVLVAAALPITS